MEIDEFQTNLCGVEAPRIPLIQIINGFQTNLCGVEADDARDGYQSSNVVSDEPLWG